MEVNSNSPLSLRNHILIVRMEVPVMATKPFYIHQKPPVQSFIRLPNFLFEAPSFCSLSSEAKLLYAMILRRMDLSRKNGWADDYEKFYLYYPLTRCVLLLCGRQKAVDTLRELQYADLISIKKQGCGKPNRIYPKHYEAVSNADFKKSGCGMPEDWKTSLMSTVIRFLEVRKPDGR